LLEDNPNIIVPCCPDYTNHNGLYNFQGLNGGVSLLAEKHIQFLEKVVKVIPDLDVLFVIADLESEDEGLRNAVKMDKSQFDQKVNSSLVALNLRLSVLGWRADFMTNLILDLFNQEELEKKRLIDDVSFALRLKSETAGRVEMYQKINLEMSFEQMFSRTVRTAAQYIILGKFANQNKKMICNHTTTNLSWYLKTGAAVLHNPIKVY
jgi:hypothetical protein